MLHQEGLVKHATITWNNARVFGIFVLVRRRVVCVSSNSPSRPCSLLTCCVGRRGREVCLFGEGGGVHSMDG